MFIHNPNFDSTASLAVAVLPDFPNQHRTPAFLDHIGCRNNSCAFDGSRTSSPIPGAHLNHVSGSGAAALSPSRG
jgi:hypothetical protein